MLNIIKWPLERIYQRPLQQRKTKAFLVHAALESKKTKKPINPPFGIGFENMTGDIGTIKQSKQLLDVKHYNAYLLISRLVYHLSIKLCWQIMTQRLGKKYEIDLVIFLTRFGYATRTGPYCKLHGAYIQYTRYSVSHTLTTVKTKNGSFK